LIAVSFFIVK